MNVSNLRPVFLVNYCFRQVAPNTKKCIKTQLDYLISPQIFLAGYVTSELLWGILLLALLLRPTEALTC